MRADVLTIAEDAIADHQGMHIGEHVSGYLVDLSTRRGIAGKPRPNAKHLYNVEYRLALIVAGCGFDRLRDLNRKALALWADEREADNMAGRTVDVHALRTTYGTHLSKGGVAPRAAQAALRHSTIDVTVNVYADPKLLDVAGALVVPPDLPLSIRSHNEPYRPRQRNFQHSYLASTDHQQ